MSARLKPENANDRPKLSALSECRARNLKWQFVKRPQNILRQQLSPKVYSNQYPDAISFFLMAIDDHRTQIAALDR